MNTRFKYRSTSTTWTKIGLPTVIKHRDDVFDILRVQCQRQQFGKGTIARDIYIYIYKRAIIHSMMLGRRSSNRKPTV